MCQGLHSSTLRSVILLSTVTLKKDTRLWCNWRYTDKFCSHLTKTVPFLLTISMLLNECMGRLDSPTFLQMLTVVNDHENSYHKWEQQRNHHGLQILRHNPYRSYKLLLVLRPVVVLLPYKNYNQFLVQCELLMIDSCRNVQCITRTQNDFITFDKVL